MGYRLYVGGYGEGVARVSFDGQEARLDGVMEAVNASYLLLSADAKTLYRTQETPGGAIYCDRVAPDGTLAPGPAAPSAGDDPCHLLLAGGLLFAANYTTGSVARFKVAADGGLESALTPLCLEGSGPDAKRQAGPHAHCAQRTPDDRYLAVCDLGADAVNFYEMARIADEVPEAARVAAPAGCGPRHAAFLGRDEVWYVACELSGELLVYRGYAERARLLQRLRLAEGGVENYPAALRISPAGDEVLVTNRGEDSIALFAVAADGTLAPARKVFSGGRWPRDAAYSPDGKWIACANQYGNLLTIFDRSALKAVGYLALETPACVAFAP